MTAPRMAGHAPRRSLPALVVALAAAAFALALGCGGGSTGSSTSGSGGAPATTPPSAAAPETTSAPGTGAPAAGLGATVYAQRCALCHGPDGRGDGPGSAALKPKPRNFHDQAYMSTRTDEQLLTVIRDGKGAMPKWGALLSEAEQKAVLAHLRELGQKP